MYKTNIQDKEQWSYKLLRRLGILPAIKNEEGESDDTI
jgi:hypothetical protein